MTDVFGGLWLENLEIQDKYFDLQCKLFEKGLTQGIQMRVAHPMFTPDVTAERLPAILDRLPRGMKLVLHFGAEKTGVDFGENLDEFGEFKKRGGGQPWKEWNRTSVAWGLAVKSVARRRIPEEFPWGIVHAGYSKKFSDSISSDLILKAFRRFPNEIGIENVPPIVEKIFYVDPEKTQSWSRAEYWGFCGTTMEMKFLLSSLGQGRRCVIDFTHLFVMCFQARVLQRPELRHYKNLEKIVVDFLGLPHWPVCHFSGIPPTLTDNHDYLATKPIDAIRDAIAQMDAVCLEIPWKPQTAEIEIENFRKSYRIF